jgi:hypothetical protein
MPNPHTFKFVRQSVPVPLEAVQAFDLLAEVMGRSRASVIAEFLLDSVPVALSMARALSEIKATRKNFINEVLVLAESVTSAKNATLEKAKASGGAPACGGHPDDLAAPLTPPSSNTGGKVPQKPKKPRSAT